MNKGIINKIYRAKDIESIQNRINQLGISKKFDAVTFLTIRMVTTILITVGLLIFFYSKYFIIPFIIIIYYNLFYYFFITLPINKRIKKLDSDALSFFEVLTLSLESNPSKSNKL